EDWVGEWKEFTGALTFGNTPSRPRMGVEIDAANGLLRVVHVVEGSGAERAGMKAEDVIIGVDGQAISAIDDLQKILAARKPGDEVTLKVSRSGSVQDVKITLR